MKLVVVFFTLISCQYCLAQNNKFANGELTGYTKFASDYVFRGESETADGEIPAIQANLTWTHQSNIYLGLFGSTNKFKSSPNVYAVIAPYIGYSNNIASLDLTYNTFWFKYHYPGASEFDYSELWLQISKPIYKLDISFELTPTTEDWFGVSGWSGTNIALSASYPITKAINLSASYGEQKLSGDGAQGWHHWNINAQLKAYSVIFDLSFHDSNIDQSHRVYGSPQGIEIFDSRIVIGVTKHF